MFSQVHSQDQSVTSLTLVTVSCDPSSLQNSNTSAHFRPNHFSEFSDSCSQPISLFSPLPASNIPSRLATQDSMYDIPQRCFSFCPSACSPLAWMPSPSSSHWVTCKYYLLWGITCNFITQKQSCLYPDVCCSWGFCVLVPAPLLECSLREAITF